MASGRKLQGKSISKAFDDAIEYFGGIKELAKAVGVSAGHMRRLRTGMYRLKLEHALKIEEVTKCKVMCQLENGGFAIVNDDMIKDAGGNIRLKLKIQNLYSEDQKAKALKNEGVDKDE